MLRRRQEVSEHGHGGQEDYERGRRRHEHGRGRHKVRENGRERQVRPESKKCQIR
jgi:hypothetical protein